MRGKSAEFNLQGLMISVAFVGLFITWITIVITGSDGSYDTTGYDPSTLAGFDMSDNLSADINSIQQEVDAVVVDKTVFDYFAGVFNAVLGPFKTTYNSYKMFRSMGTSAVGALGLHDSVGQFIVTVIVVLLIVDITEMMFVSNNFFFHA